MTSDTHEETQRIPVGEVTLAADLTHPPKPKGVVLFAHGSGSSRRSPRNRYVAGELQAAGMATVLVDLLTPDEDRADRRTANLRFDIDFLAGRLVGLCDWLTTRPGTGGLALGLFGASTGAAAALVAAAMRPESVGAVVSRGGRPDLAGEFLARVDQPTLLIVGSRDPVVLELNRDAQARLAGFARLEVVPAATHLFEEPGAIEQVARLARDWFASRLEIRDSRPG